MWQTTGNSGRSGGWNAAKKKGRGNAIQAIYFLHLTYFIFSAFQFAKKVGDFPFVYGCYSDTLMTEDLPSLEKVGRTDETGDKAAFLPSATGPLEPLFNFVLRGFSSYIPQG